MAEEKFCKVCGKLIYFKRTYCSYHCASNCPDKKSKAKHTCLEKYGVDNPAQSFSIKEKMKQTCLEKYGGFSFQSEEIKEKIKKTMNDRYGVDYSFQSKDILEKFVDSCQEKYGVNNPFQAEEIKEKIRQTTNIKYKTNYYVQSENFKDKMKQTCLEKYGVENYSQFHLKDILSNLHSQEWWDSFNSFLDVKSELDGKLSDSQIFKRVNQYRPDWEFKSSISSHHQRIIDLLTDNKIDHETNTRKIISPLELDIFIPSKNLAIEINGVYWHSELQGKDRHYHLNKTLECEKKGIQLLHFWDVEVEQKWDIVSSMILSKCGIYEKRIGARCCKVKEVLNQEEREFLKQNHLQGYRPSTICYGLYFQDELMSLMSFGKPRFNKRVDWELLRFCNKLNTQVLGGASKLFARRPKCSIISYSDRRYSQGHLYTQLGMILKQENSPSYSYTDDYKVFYNRVKFQKHKLSKFFEMFDPSITEWENMKMNGYDRIWDCGTISFTT